MPRVMKISRAFILSSIFAFVVAKPNQQFYNSTITLKDCCRPRMSGHPYIPEADRIVGGEYARPGQFPWMVSLQEEDDFGFEHACGAAILNEYWVITAAHCIEYHIPEMYQILAGVHKLSESNTPTTKHYTVSRIVIHPLYNNDNLHNDIALLQIARPIDIRGSKGYINGVCLPVDKKDPTGFAAVAGWGHEMEDGENSDTLKYVLVPIIPRDMCNEAYDEDPYDDIDEILDTMICAGMTGRDSCQNDSGGPLVQTDDNGVSTLIGIVSNGAGCGLKYYPGIYTKVSMYQDWIESVMIS